jgi:outer membrane protein OmpA-like peptidoglycan-associated protein
MFPLRESLSLSRTWTDEDEVVVISWFEWQRVHAESGYHEIDSHRALWMLTSLDCHHLMEARHFISDLRLNSFPLSQMDDDEVLELIRQALNNRRLVAIQKGAEQPAIPSVTVQLRRLVAQVEKATHGKLSHQGRQYKLVVDVELASTPGRGYYEVASQSEARAALDSLAKISPASADLLKQASDKLTKDWSPPSQPDGLILLRRIPTQSSAPKDTGLAITPSQLRTLMESEKPLQFFARFVDERGKPVSGLIGEFEHSGDPKCDMAFSGSGFARMGEIKGAKQAWLRFSEKANQDLTDELCKRWKEVRGEADEAWKKNEEALVELFFKEGKLSELQLEAEKKHTFMLRPPVAQASMHGMYFDTNKCFILPTAVGSLKRLVEIYQRYPDSEVLIVGHTDTAGSEAYNLDLSADRADAMKAYLRDDAESWLAWYGDDVRESKRWGEHEDTMMINALVPEDGFGEDSHVAAYQNWHNGDSADDRQPDQPRSQPDGWEELKVDGILGPKTRRQLLLDYMNLDGTSLEDDVRIVTYGCGEYFPLASEEGDVDPDAQDDEEVQFDRRVEVFFFAKPFGILPAVPGVADGESPDKAVEASKGDELYLEWRVRAAKRHSIEPDDSTPSVVVEWPEYLTDILPDDLAIELVAEEEKQTLAWTDGLVTGEFRRFVFDADPSTAKCSLIAHAGDRELLLWDKVVLDDPSQPPAWEHLISELAQELESEPEEDASDQPQPETSAPHAIDDLD